MITGVYINADIIKKLRFFKAKFKMLYELLKIF